MKLSNEMALIVRITNTLQSTLDDLRAAADNCEDPSLAQSTLDGYTRMLNEAQHYINNSRPQVEGRVYLTDPKHICDVGKVFGLVEAQEKLAEAKEQYGKAITGVALAKTIVDGLVAECKLHASDRNIVLAIESGFDIRNDSLRLSADHLGYYLHVLTDTDEQPTAPLPAKRLKKEMEGVK